MTLTLGNSTIRQSVNPVTTMPNMPHTSAWRQKLVFWYEDSDKVYKKDASNNNNKLLGVNLDIAFFKRILQKMYTRF